MTAELILPILNNGLWHTTHPDRFSAILTTGAILPFPPSANPDGWKTLGGDEYCPYAKKLGGVSLFDFDNFDPETYRVRCPFSSWDEFVPYRSKWGGAVWIEIDRTVLGENLISGVDVVSRWKLDNAYGHNFMPYIEAVHLGPVPAGSFKRAFLVRKDDMSLYSLGLPTG